MTVGEGEVLERVHGREAVGRGRGDLEMEKPK